MAKLGWGKKKITEGCITDWYKDHPIGEMVKDMKENHRLLAMEHGGGKYKDSILAYERCRFMKALGLPEPDIKANPSETYIELSVAVKIWEETKKAPEPVEEPEPIEEPKPVEEPEPEPVKEPEPPKAAVAEQLLLPF